MIYNEIMGVPPDARNPPHMQAVLNNVARALSNLVVIYAPAPGSGMPKPAASADLIEGQFLRGARVLRTKGGDDMLNAISVLQSAHIRFRGPGES